VCHANLYHKPVPVSDTSWPIPVSGTRNWCVCVMGLTPAEAGTRFSDPGGCKAELT